MSRNKNLNSTKIAIRLSQIKVILESNAEASPHHPPQKFMDIKSRCPCIIISFFCLILYASHNQNNSIRQLLVSSDPLSFISTPVSPNKPKALNQPNKACGNEKGQISLVVGFSLHFVSTWMLVAAHTNEVTAELSTGASKTLNICIGVSLVL